MTDFYEFNQKIVRRRPLLSEGNFSNHVFIEAESQKEAIESAKRLGIFLEDGRWESYVSLLSFPLYVGNGFHLMNIEEYAQYHADRWAYTTPDSRIFYKGGAVHEVIKDAPMKFRISEEEFIFEISNKSWMDL